MKETLPPIIQASELLQLYRSQNLVLVDASSGENSRIKYANKHLDGAISIDLNTHLSQLKNNFSNGGRHPLPRIENFTRIIASFGISPESHIVIYDDKNGSNAAARFWWMLRSIGLEKVQVLNGGLEEAEKIGFPTNSTTVTVTTSDEFKVKKWKLPTADLSEVENSSQTKQDYIIDVRSPERYDGVFEPIDLIAGHIPNAINIPLTENLDNTGLFLSPAQLKEKYEPLFNHEGKDIIVHCGSGVTACHTLLAINYAGFKIPKLYVGSWSEWSRNDKPIAIK